MLAGTAAIIQINTEDSPRLAARFGVRGIPVLHFLQGGKSLDQLAGAQQAESIVAWCRRRLGS
jgi:thioredoxin-like negative regulator of GroEL